MSPLCEKEGKKGSKRAYYGQKFTGRMGLGKFEYSDHEMRYRYYHLAIHRYSPSGRFCENGICLTFILRRLVPRQLHAGTVRLWQMERKPL